ncbi:hypothetical protein COP2_041407 [Malus domestica]
MCVQEEERLKVDKTGEVNLVQMEKGSKSFNVGSTFTAGKKKNNVISSSFKNANTSKGSVKLKLVNTEIEKEKECYFCKETGHLRRNCVGFKNWLTKKGLLKNKGSKQ